MKSIVSLTGMFVNKDSTSYETSSSSSSNGTLLMMSGKSNVLLMTNSCLVRGCRYFEITLDALYTCDPV